MTLLDPVNKYKKVVPEIFKEIPKPPTHSKVIIIGSGFGGAISAWRLAEAGIKSTILERVLIGLFPKIEKLFLMRFAQMDEGFVIKRKLNS